MTHSGPFQPLLFCDSVILCRASTVQRRELGPLLLTQCWQRALPRAGEVSTLQIQLGALLGGWHRSLSRGGETQSPFEGGRA